MQKGQGAAEFLLTYGWAIAIIAVVLGVIMYATGNSASGATCQSQSQAIHVLEWSVVEGQGGVGLTLRNATGGDIYPIQATGLGAFYDYNTTAMKSKVGKGETFTLRGISAKESGEKFSDGKVLLQYATKSGLITDAVINCAGSSQAVAVVVNLARDFWQGQSLALEQAYIDQPGNTAFIIKNNTAGAVSLFGYTANGDAKTFNTTDSQIQPGESRTFYLARDNPCHSAACTLDNLSFQFRDSLGDDTTTDSTDITVERSQAVTRAMFDGPSTLICVNNSEVGICSPSGSAIDTNFQTGWSTLDTNLNNTYLKTATAPLTLPSLTGQDGKCLTTNGADINWNTCGGTATAGGSNGQIQFNNSGTLGGDSNLTWDKTNKSLILGGASETFGSANPRIGVLNSAPSTSSLSLIYTGASGASNTAGITLGVNDGAAISSGDRIGTLVYAGTYDNNNNFRNAAAIETYSSQDWNLSQSGTDMLFATTTNGSTSRNEKMRLTNSGRLGIGTTSPSYTLDVRGTAQIKSDTSSAGLVLDGAGSPANYSLIQMNSYGTRQWQIASRKDTNRLGLFYYDGATWTEPITVLPSGYVGIGTATPVVDFQLMKSVAAPVVMTVQNNQTTGSRSASMQVATYAGGTIRLVTNATGSTLYGIPDGMGGIATEWSDMVFAPGSGGTSTERMRLTNSGRLGIGRTPATYALEVAGDAGKTSGGTAWTSISDSRLKDVLSNDINGLEKIMDLKPVKFKYNDKYLTMYASDDKKYYGFLAQELAEVVPEMVTKDQNGYYWYNPSGFEAILTSAIQEQQGQIDALKEENNTIKEELCKKDNTYSWCG